jgi:hypothetical protein
MKTMSDTAEPATGLAGAAQAIEDLLAGSGTEDFEQAAADDDDQSTDAPGEGAEEAHASGDETTSDDEPAEGADEEDPGDEAAADDDDDEEASATPQLHTVKVNGKEERVTLEEALRGYQRHADYSQKTAALAEERRAFENGDKAEVTRERAQYAHLLGALHQALQHMQPREPDWDALYAENPLEFFRQKDAWRDRQEQMSAAQSELQRIAGLQQAEQANALARHVAENQARMAAAMPEASDPSKWNPLRAKILAYGKKLGFTDQELARAYDHRAVIALNKARLYDELMAARPRPVERKGPKPLRAGSGNTAPKAEQTSLNKAAKRLAQTGSVDDAAAVFALLS